jgi:activator of HSP90 ATPase
MENSIKLSVILKSKPEDVYRSWLDSKAHGLFTGSKAVIDPQVNGKFTAWDGYISGRNLILEPYRRIVQSWRTSDFPEGCADSCLELIFEDHEHGTKLNLIHTDIPSGQAGEYEEGWKEYYFKGMKEFFNK